MTSNLSDIEEGEEIPIRLRFPCYRKRSIRRSHSDSNHLPGFSFEDIIILKPDLEVDSINTYHAAYPKEQNVMAKAGHSNDMETETKRERNEPLLNLSGNDSPGSSLPFVDLSFLLKTNSRSVPEGDVVKEPIDNPKKVCNESHATLVSAFGKRNISATYKKYSMEESKTIFQFIKINKVYQFTKGSRLYKRMEELRVTERPAQSMQNHVVKLLRDKRKLANVVGENECEQILNEMKTHEETLHKNSISEEVLALCTLKGKVLGNDPI